MTTPSWLYQTPSLSAGPQQAVPRTQPMAMPQGTTPQVQQSRGWPASNQMPTWLDPALPGGSPIQGHAAGPQDYVGGAEIASTKVSPALRPGWALPPEWMTRPVASQTSNWNNFEPGYDALIQQARNGTLATGAPITDEERGREPLGVAEPLPATNVAPQQIGHWGDSSQVYSPANSRTTQAQPNQQMSGLRQLLQSLFYNGGGR